MRRRTGILAFVIVLIVLIGGFAFRGGDAVAGGVTRSGIRALQIGMTEDEVVQILGQPLKTTLHPELGGVTTLEYARPVRGVYWYPMLWIHVKGGRVSEVYAKKYILWGADDEAVYWLSDTRRSEGRDFESTFRR